MKFFLLCCFFLMNVGIIALTSQEIDRTSYQLMSRDDAFRHWFNAGRPAGGRYILEGHFIEVGIDPFSRRNEMVFFSNGFALAWPSNISPNNISRGQAVHIYYRIFRRAGANTGFMIDYIEAVDERFFIGQRYLANVNLNMRTRPSISSTIITTIRRFSGVTILEKGDEATIDGITSVWVRAEQGGEIGWLFGGYLELNQIFFEWWDNRHNENHEGSP